jgi:16S rRNA (guanine527-N7)-methyltransferase
VREGGAVVLWVGPSADRERVVAVASRVGGRLVSAPEGFIVIEKIGPTPPGFPRRPGVAKKRPLA